MSCMEQPGKHELSEDLAHVYGRLCREQGFTTPLSPVPTNKWLDRAGALLVGVILLGMFAVGVVLPYLSFAYQLLALLAVGVCIFGFAVWLAAQSFRRRTWDRKDAPNSSPDRNC